MIEEVEKMTGKIKGDIVTSSLTRAEEKHIQSAKDELKELESRYEYMRREYRNNFINIGNIIGSSENLEALVYKPNHRFWDEFNDKRTLLGKVAEKDVQLHEKDLKIIKAGRRIEELRREANEKYEISIVSGYQLQDEINYLRDQLRILDTNKQEFDKERLSKKHEKTKALAQANNYLLADKSAAVQNFPANHLKYTEPAKGTTSESIRQKAFQENKAKNEALLEKLREQNRRVIESKKREVLQRIINSSKTSWLRKTPKWTNLSRSAKKRRRSASTLI